MRINPFRRRVRIAEDNCLAANSPQCAPLRIEGVALGQARPKNWLVPCTWPAVLALAVICLACASVSRAQCVTAPANNVTLQNQGVVMMDPVVWAPGHTYTVTITGIYPSGGNPSDCQSLSAWQWPGYPDWWETGPNAQYINISDPTWVSPTLTTFDVSVDSGAPTGNVFFELRVPGGEDFWGVLVQPPPPPNQPGPPSSGPNLPCPPPKFDPNNPVTPDTWIPGQTYNTAVKGTGFTTQAGSSFPYCP